MEPATMKPFKTLVLAFTVAASSAVAGSALAALKTETIQYEHDGTQLQGYLAYDDAVAGKRPGVVVVHEWWGLNDYVRKRADMLAELGYVTFAIDMYGEDKATQHGDQAKEWMSQITANVDRWRERALLGLDLLRKRDEVDPQRVAAIGYCFGGATVMQMAYAGADLDGVVSFHGSLPTPAEGQTPNIKAKVMVAHGNADGFVPAERVGAFTQAMINLGVDFRFYGYDGVYHGFTNPDAAQYGIPNVKYDAAADQASWEAMKAFFEEIFAAGN
jgi:dienelactone hydrolase